MPGDVMHDASTFRSEWEQYGDVQVASLPLFDLTVRPTTVGWYYWRVKDPESGQVLARGRTNALPIAQEAAERTAELLARHDW